MSFERKFKKLLRAPSLFWEDMYLRHSHKLKTLNIKRYKGYEKYTIVSAVYNTEKYLNDFFKTLIKQHLDFKNNIYVIMVDDGSTDNTADIIKRWQKRYPENIKYVYKENGGAASARNFGLKYVKTDWVTFSDSDDFFDLCYFHEVDKIIQKNKNLKLINCNLILYREKTKQFSDTHPLNYKFANGDATLPLKDLENYITLSAATSFFKMDIIRDNSLYFDTKIRPNFEDAHFIGMYLLASIAGNVGFSSKAKYFYRKRENGTSTLDSTSKHYGAYLDVLEFGYIDLLVKYKNAYGIVPAYIQKTVLYDMNYIIKRVVNNENIIGFLNNRQIKKFVDLTDTIFGYIDIDTIMNFNIKGFWFFDKVGKLNTFKKTKPAFQIAYITRFDDVKSQILITYLTSSVGFEAFYIDGKDVIPDFTKTIKYDFVGQTYVLERWIWLNISGYFDEQKLMINIDGMNARIDLNKQHNKNGVNIGDIRKYFINKKQKHYTISRFANSWIFMDRNAQADDNAEHIYRYISKNYPDKSIFFVLNKNSHDWQRLKNDGFRLLAYGSKKHEIILRSCSHIISSHADHYVVDYFNDKSLQDKKFIFLQHGVTKNDLSRWLNSKKIDCFVTTAHEEYESIAGDENRYKFTKKEVVLTGFPRHDELLNKKTPLENILLIMPTWRNSLAGKTTFGSIREINHDFINSQYFTVWHSLLNNRSLLKYAKDFGYSIVFFPHANIQPYLKFFDIPNEIKIMGHSDGSIQDIFKRSKIMLTDYSSVAMDFAYLKKAVVYYQFDEDDFFGGSHTLSKGYFDYRNDGFGPVVTKEKKLIEVLKYMFKNSGAPDDKYLKRIDNFFLFRDGKCCERVYQAICKLDEPQSNIIDKNILYEYINNAQKYNNVTSLVNRYIKLLEIEKDTDMAYSAQEFLKKRFGIKQAKDINSYRTITAEPIITVDILHLDKDILFIEGVGILRGVDFGGYEDVDYKLRCKDINTEKITDLTLAKGNKPNLTKDYFNGDFVVYDKAW
ncbi:MAG: CDP-glycerol glycerophosphotransferase family protein, partial [Campylobacteraceae bacterium]|nr:CDP-glycerol glycerophosphotransferase family protein [Campylobacteraceae bacterium]